MLVRLWLKWAAVRLTLLPWPSCQRRTLSLCRAWTESLTSSRSRAVCRRASAACSGSRRASVAAPGMIDPYVCIGTPYRPRLIHSGAQHLSGRAHATMLTWGEFAKTQPELAEAGQALLCQFGVALAFLATTRAEGAPRVHPIAPQF